ncbi:MAG: hypothetical protein JXB32_18150 [Deltaproteobacteria bacterium]|nr:hypothetical protein [Deltaproteobacteria bacterium]
MPRPARLPRSPRPGPLLRRALAFLDRVGTTLVEKNAADGDSVGCPLRIFSRAPADEQLRVRIDDKLSRVARGARGGGDDEDTLLDLVGYLALLAGARRARPRRSGGGRP